MRSYPYCHCYYHIAMLMTLICLWYFLCINPALLNTWFVGLCLDIFFAQHWVVAINTADVMMILCHDIFFSIFSFCSILFCTFDLLVSILFYPFATASFSIINAIFCWFRFVLQRWGQGRVLMLVLCWKRSLSPANKNAILVRSMVVVLPFSYNFLSAFLFSCQS